MYSRGYVAKFFVNEFITHLVQNMEARSWMYDRVNADRRGLKHEFIEGVDEFVRKAKELPYYASDGGIRCPCTRCRCMKLVTESEVKLHLYERGFKPDYWVWTEHREVEPEGYWEGLRGLSTSVVDDWGIRMTFK